MSSMTSSHTHMGCLVVRTVLGSSGKQFQTEVENYLSKNGPEWFVNRNKAIWNAANHLRNGDKEAAVQLYRENSISYHKSTGYPKGAFKTAVAGYVEASRPSVIKRYASVLRFYTSVRLDGLSEKQKTKAQKAITDYSPGTYLWDMAYEGPEKVFPKATQDALVTRLRTPPLGKVYKPERILPRLRASSYYYSREKIRPDHRDKPASMMALSFLTEGDLPDSIDRFTGLRRLRRKAKAFEGRVGNKEIPAYGRITALQEQGAKARVVAMPSAPVQLGFYPLHLALDGAIRRDPYLSSVSAVHDQTKAVHAVTQKMNQGKPVFSTDLGSATDRFPRQYSLQILRDLGGNEWADAIDDVSAGTWRSPWGDTTYQVGQPMGLYGSFPLFHLSNVLAAATAQRRQYPAWSEDSQNPDLTSDEVPELFANGHTFYVLGDDIIFSDERVATEYRGAMSILNVPISEHKSYSGNVAEFAGFMVLKGKDGYFPFRPYKVPDSDEVTNPIQFLDSLGVKVSNLSRSGYWSRMERVYRSTASSRDVDLSPLVHTGMEQGGIPQRISGSTLDGIAQGLISSRRYHLPPTKDLTPFTETFVKGSETIKVVDGSDASAGVSRTTPLSPINPYDPRATKPEDDVNPMRVRRRLRQDPLIAERLREDKEKAEKVKSLEPVLPEPSSKPQRPVPSLRRDLLAEIRAETKRPKYNPKEVSPIDKGDDFEF